MVSQRKNPTAIVMGDIVGSSKAESTKELHRKFNRGVVKLNKKFSNAIVSPLTITLGDEFQGLADSLTSAFSIIHEARLYFLNQKIRTRFVLGRGAIETPVNTERAWNMMGPGLSEARRRLNDKKEPSAYRFSFPEKPVLQDNLNTFGYTLTEVEGGWTETQREYVSYVLANSDRTYAEIARKLKVSERNVYKVLRAAKTDLYARQLRSIQSTLEHLSVGAERS